MLTAGFDIRGSVRNAMSVAGQESPSEPPASASDVRQVADIVWRTAAGRWRHARKVPPDRGSILLGSRRRRYCSGVD